jgi:hypothetical protein
MDYEASILTLLIREDAMSIPELAASVPGLTTGKARTIVNQLVKEERVEPLGTNYSNARCYGIKRNG